MCLANPENLQTENRSKRVFRPHHFQMDERTHDNTMIWAEQAVQQGSHVNGIIAKSIFATIPNFDVIRDMPPEPMHLLDTGFMKNTCLKIFNAGTSPQTKPGYRRSPIGQLSELLRYTDTRNAKVQN